MSPEPEAASPPPNAAPAPQLTKAAPALYSAPVPVQRAPSEPATHTATPVATAPPAGALAVPALVLPPRPRRSWVVAVLAVLLVLSTAVMVGGGVTAVVAVGGGASGGGALFVDELRPSVRAAALQALLDRRAKAVRDRDKQAFLADVDRSDPAFVRRQEQEYDNLVKLPLAEFRYELKNSVEHNELIPAAVRSRYHSVVRAAGVSVRYRVEGVDDAVVTAPWVPVFGATGGRWRLAGLATDAKLPTGTGGQAWEAGPITVARSRRVLLVLSADDAGRADEMLRLAEKSLDHVAAVRPGGWVGQVMITAVQDARLFTTYFAEAPDRIDQFAAIAVPYHSEVPDWGSGARYVATRIVFNPNEFGADPATLAHDLTHEFVHAAMGPVTTGNSPLWLVEGFAEYVAFKPEQVSGQWLRRVLDGVTVGGRPPEDSDFYADGRNYALGWLACRMIAERYGEAKLVALYEAFASGHGYGTQIDRVLGVSEETLHAQYVAYVAQARRL